MCPGDALVDLRMYLRTRINLIPNIDKQRIKRMYIIKILPVSSSLSVYLSLYAIKIDTKDIVNSCIKFSLSLSLSLSLCAACFKSICEVSKANFHIWVKTGLSMAYIL